MTLKKRQAEALELLKRGHNVFLSGEAGTGKSFVIDQFTDYLDRNGIKYVVCAPTGLAAINVDGATLHRTFKLSTDLGDGQVNLKNVEEAEVIIIDEISMCRRDIFQYIARALFEFENPLKEYDIKREAKICRKKQLVLVGDFFQLPPVLGNNDRKNIEQMKKQGLEVYEDLINLEEKIYAFQCKEWERFNFKNVVLNEVVRQSDKEYIDNLNKIRRGDSEGLEFIKKEASKNEIKNAIYLTSKNKDAENLNQSNLDKIKGKEYTYYAEEEGEVSESDKPVQKYLKFKAGARVMSVVNITEKDKEDNVVVVNGMCGTITDLNNDSVTVLFDNGNEHKFEKYKWSIKGFKEVVGSDEEGKPVKTMMMSEIGSYRQIPLKLAWAITIHKSQGQTYEEVNLNPSCFCEGQLYVALSRAKDLKKLYLTKTLRKSYLKTSEVVKEFYEKIEKEADEEVAITVEEFTEVEDTKIAEVAEELFEAKVEEEYVMIKVPKTLENQVLNLLEGNIDNKVNSEEIEYLKSQIKTLEEELEKLKASAKRRPRVGKEIEDKIIKLRKTGMGMNKIAKEIGVGAGTVQRVLKENQI